MDTITYFMWGYQRYFAVYAKSAAKSIFDLLDNGLRPNVFLLGFLTEEREDRHPICIEPEDYGYDPEFFSRAKELASDFEKIDPERNIFHSHPLAQSRHEKGLKTKLLERQY